MEEYSYYDESIYLDSSKNTEALKKINYENERCKYIVERNLLKYKSGIQEYDSYLNLIAYLIKELSIPNNAISSSITLDKLTKRGIFSNFGKFTLDIQNSNNIIGCLGINIVSGVGCCRHIATFQSDVIKRLNLMSEPFYCYITKRNLDNAYDIQGNHMINLIEYDGTLYVYDAIFDCLFRFVDSLKLESIYNDKKLYIYYKPYIDMIINGVSVDNINNLIKLFDNLKDNGIISCNEYIDICRYTKDVIDKNGELLKDFRESSKKYVKRIVQELK